jgi:hypothetical protein
MAFSVTTISPEQQLQYDQGRSNARQDLLRGRAGTQYQRGLLTQDYADRTQDFNTQWNRQRESLPTSYIQSGIFNSGIYRDALKRYAIDRLAGQRGLQRDYQQRMAGMTFDDRGAEDQYANTVSNLFGNQYAAQASIASALKGIM